MHQVNLNIIKDDRAMTLIELMVVLSIIAIMLGVSAPTFFNYQHTLKLRTAARELASDIRYARQVAVSKNTTQQLCFDGTNTNMYTIYSNNACSGTVVKTVNIAQAFTGVTKSGGATLVFSSLGTVSPANTAFTLTRSDIANFSATKTITVSGAGNVTIQ
jgi:prepilin-type N-terminal cleavage/methylation domain-containing protein